MLARHDATGTPVAIKFLRPDLLADQGFAAMFRTEAVTLGAVDSPYVVRLYEYVEAPAGAAIIMELVDGVSLHEIVARHGKTTPEAALVVLYGSLLGLAALAAFVVVVATGFVLSDQIARPLGRLAASARQIGEGDLGVMPFRAGETLRWRLD